MRFVAALLVLLLSIPASAAWEGSGGDSDNIDCGSRAALDDMTAWTHLEWVWINTLAAGAQRFAFKGSSLVQFSKAGGGSTFGQNGFWARATTASEAQAANSTLTTGSWLFLAARYTSGRAGTCTTADDTGCDIQLRYGDLTTRAVRPAGTHVIATDGSGAHTTDAASSLQFGGDGGTASLNGILGRAMYVEQDLTDNQIWMLQFAPLAIWNSFAVSRSLIQPYDASNTPDMSGGDGTSVACTVTGGAVGTRGLPLR